MAVEDDGLIVVAKTSGWVVHASEATESRDLRRWLDSQGHEGCSPLHRLDRGASGVVLYSANPELRASLGKAFAEGEVAKRYQALVHGRTHTKGTIRVPVLGRPAVTRYRLLRRLGGFSLLRVRPETGRHHQIRRHLHGIGHSLVGDDRYKPRGFRPVPGFPGRLFLHASALELPDGRTWSAPLPDELERCLTAVSANAQVPPST